MTLGAARALPGPSPAMTTIAALLEARTGQQIAANRTWRIETALKPLLRGQGLHSLDALVAALAADPGGPLAELVVDALLNQETSFFRDAAVLDQVADAVAAMQAAAPDRRVRIWSAGCSTGQEPLSLSLLFVERGLAPPGQEPEIVASDISQAALARGRSGRYSQFEIQRGLSVHRMVEWFDNVGGDWVARPALVRRVQFRQQNLTADPPPPGRFDIILCRNVLLYFTPETRMRVFETLAAAIRPGGLLVLGAGETVIGLTDQFRPSGRYRGFYRAEPEQADGEPRNDRAC